MNIIKLSATNSTNEYLKNLCATRYVENFTIVVTESQTAGKGQMGAVWEVEPGKNLTFSILIKDLLLGVNEIFNLNVAVAVSIFNALKIVGISDLAIKWPNDILAGNKKIGGVLIENSIKSGGEIFSVIGIGINVNQQDFANIPKASSLALVTGREHDVYTVLNQITANLKQNVSLILNKDTNALWDTYHKNLYKKGVPMPFESHSQRFMGIINGVANDGSLMIQLEDDTVKNYIIKEVQMLY